MEVLLVVWELQLLLAALSGAERFFVLGCFGIYLLGSTSVSEGVVLAMGWEILLK